MSDGVKFRNVIDRTKKAAEQNGIELRPDGTESPPETLDEMVSDLINIEWIAEDLETGETAHGESMDAAWANLRSISKQEVHDKKARWHDGN